MQCYRLLQLKKYNKFSKYYNKSSFYYPYENKKKKIF